MAAIKLTLFLSLCVAYAAAKDCSFSHSDLKIEPVILTSTDGAASYNVYYPESDIATFKEGTQLMSLCAGTDNKFATVSGIQMDLTCNKGAFEDAQGKQHDFKNLQCAYYPNPDIRVNDETCAEGKGVVMDTGFYYNDNKFAVLSSVCYDIFQGTVILENM